MPEIGRISGPLLKSNLTRDRVPLAFETDLLYLNVSDANSANHKIGIKNVNPAFTLDISGTVRARETFLVRSTLGGPNAFAEIDDVNIDGNKIQTTVGNLVLQAATGSDQVQINSDLTISSDLAVNGGDITTNQTTFNLINTTATTGNLFGAATAVNIGAATGTTTIRNDLQVDGNLGVTGDINLGGSINIGNADTDNVVFGADINSSVIPNITDTYDLGSMTKVWRAGYFNDVIVDGLSVGNISVQGSFINDQIEIVGNLIRTFRSNADLELDTAGTGQVVVYGQGGVVMPVGTTAERPIPPRVGTLRFNTDDARFENYNGGEWNRMIHDDDAIAFAIALG